MIAPSSFSTLARNWVERIPLVKLLTNGGRAVVTSITLVKLGSVR